MGFHDDSCFIVINSGQERTVDRGDKTVVELGCVLPEIPNISLSVLSKKIKGIFCKLTVGEDRIMYLNTTDTINDSSFMSHGKHVSDCSVRVEVGKSCARKQWKVRIVDSRCEVTRIDDRVVGSRPKFLTTLLPHLKSSLAGIKRIGQIGFSSSLARLPRCRVNDVNAFTKR